MAIEDITKAYGLVPTTSSTGTLGLKAPSPAARIGSRISSNLIKMGGYDPMALPYSQRSQARSAGLKELADRLYGIGATFSGDPARMALYQEMQKAKQPKAGTTSLERFGVYDAKGNVVGSIAKSDAISVTKIEQNPNLYLGPLAAPSVGTAQSSSRFSIIDKKTNQPIGSVLQSDFARIAEIEKDPNLQIAPFTGIDASGVQPTEFERLQSRYLDLSSKQNLTETQKLELRTLESKLFGTDLIPFFNEDGLQVTTITQAELAKDPDIINRLEEEGLFSVGAKSAFATKGVKSPLSDMAENYLDEKSQLNAINDLATIIYSDRDAFTLAGSLAGLVNTGRYQLESAARLAKLNDFAQLNPTEYAKYNERIDGLLDNQYGKILDQISQDRAVAKSIFLKLAYAIAKDIDPSGRLSDNDVKIAMSIIGELGADWKSNLSTLENLSKTSTRDYLDRYEIQYDNLKKEDDIAKAAKYGQLPKFLGGIDWRSGTTQTTQTSSGISPEIDAMLKELGID